MIVVFVASVIQERHSSTTIREMLDKKPFALRGLVIFAGLMLVLVFEFTVRNTTQPHLCICSFRSRFNEEKVCVKNNQNSVVCIGGVLIMTVTR